MNNNLDGFYQAARTTECWRNQQRFNDILDWVYTEEQRLLQQWGQNLQKTGQEKNI